MNDSKCIYAGETSCNYVVLYNSIESVIATIKLIDEGFKKGEHYNFVFITPDVVSQKIDADKNLYSIADILQKYAESRLHVVDKMGYMDYGDKWFKMIHYDATGMAPCHGCIMYSYMCAVEMATEYEDARLVSPESSEPISCFYINSKQAINRMSEFAKLNDIDIVRPLENLDKEQMMEIYREFMDRYGLEEKDFQYPICLICKPNHFHLAEENNMQDYDYINERLYPRLCEIIKEIKDYQEKQQFVYSDRKED